MAETETLHLQIGFIQAKHSGNSSKFVSGWQWAKVFIYKLIWRDQGTVSNLLS